MVWSARRTGSRIKEETTAGVQQSGFVLRQTIFQHIQNAVVECCFTSTETVGLLGTAASIFKQLLSSAQNADDDVGLHPQKP